MSQATQLLFDVPGRRGRRRILIGSIVISIAIAGVIALALRQFAINGQLEGDKWAFFGYGAIIGFIGHGLLGTFLATGVAAVVAFPLGLLLALGRLSTKPVPSKIVGGWVEVFRSIPMLLVVYALLLGLPSFGIVLPVFWMLVIPMILVSSATTAEVFRAGVLAVDVGQWEAAASLGMQRNLLMRLVVLPQAFRIVLPSLLTGLVSLLKDSTLGYVVSYQELMQQGKTLASYYGYLIQTYLVISVIYVVINFGLTRLAERLQRRGNRKTAAAGVRTEGIEPEMA